MSKNYQEKIKQIQLKKFREMVKVLLKGNRFYKKKLLQCGIKSVNDIKTWEDFQKIPFTTKKELIDDQKKNPQYGSNLSYPEKDYVYITSTSGTASGKRFKTLYTKSGYEEAVNQEFLWMKSMKITKADRCMFVLPFGLYPMLTEAAMRIGAKVLPGDGKNSLDLLKNIQDLKPTVIEMSPSGVFHLIEDAKYFGTPLSKLGVKKIILTGEIGATIPSVRDKVEREWKVDCYDALGSTEVGIFSYECEKKQGPHLYEEETIFEVINPKTGKEDIEGELVATPLWRLDFPFIRYRTGDFVRISKKPCKCGCKSATLVGGIIGKVDGSIKIRTVLYYPTEIEGVIRKFPEISEFRVEIVKRRGLDEMDVVVELSVMNWSVKDLLFKEMEKYMGFYPNISVVAPNTLERQAWKTVRIIDKRSQTKVTDKANFKESIYTKLSGKFYYHYAKLKKLMMSEEIKD